MHKKLNKYVSIFDYIEKILIILSATIGGISIISFASIIGVPAGIESASHLLSTTRKEKKKIPMLAKSKFNSIETLISQALNDMNISHEEFIAILKEKDKYEKMKENIRDKNENKKQDIIKLNSIE